MPNIDEYELDLLNAYEKGKLKSVATKAELAKFKAVARATAIKDRRVNIRLSSGDLSDIQVKALEEGIPYQTLIASVLHKYVTGRLSEHPNTSSPKKAIPHIVKRRSSSAVLRNSVTGRLSKKLDPSSPKKAVPRAAKRRPTSAS